MPYYNPDTGRELKAGLKSSVVQNFLAGTYVDSNGKKWKKYTKSELQTKPAKKAGSPKRSGKKATSPRGKKV